MTFDYNCIYSCIHVCVSPKYVACYWGFTEHASSKFTAFIALETILIYKKFNRDLELLTVDAEKACDTVNHDIMLNKLYHDGITGDMWLLPRNIYDGLVLKVKWGDQTTESIDIKQEIRQGAKLSTFTHHFFRNACTKSGSLRFSQFPVVDWFCLFI